MNSNICCIFNFGSFYRSAIYQLMDKELNCDFYIGANLPGEIKTMDYNRLNGYKKSLKNTWFFGNYYWQHGAIGLVFKPYKHIVMGGEPYCVSNWMILLLAKLLGKKTYLWSHGWYGRESKLKAIVKKLFFGLANHVFLYGHYAKELMINEGFPASKLTCIYNSLDYDVQVAQREKLKPSSIYSTHFKNNFPNLIFIGRLTKVKRLDLLLHAMAKLKFQKQHYNLTLIGSGEQEEELLVLVKELGLEANIWFYGVCYEEKELSKLIFNADLCVSPGNVGLTAMHTMVYGTPVISHNNFAYQMPEFEAIQEGTTGKFFEQGNVDSLVGSIKRWFNSGIKREVIRESCYRVINEKYNPHVQIKILKKIII